MKSTTKTLIADYTTNFRDFGEITVPKGTKTTNQTACGIDERYNFVNEYEWINTNYKNIAPILRHYVIYYGINVPKDFLSE